MNEPLAIVLAAGQGTRMQTQLPKVLVEVCGRAMVHFVLDALADAGIERMLVVVGYRADDVRRTLAGRPEVVFVEQAEQLGTGHAVIMCRDQLVGHDGPVLIVTGDSPLIQTESVAALLDLYRSERPACILGTQHAEDPTGLGRIVRDRQDDFVAIVEEKDATESQRKITEVNMSTYVFDCRELLWSLDRIANNNRQGEYYVTDCPGILKDQGKDVRALPVLRPCEALSVNTLADLQAVETEMKKMGYCQ